MSRHHERSVENKNKVEKRHRVSEKRRMRNSVAKSRARTMITRTRRAVQAGDQDAVAAGLAAAFSALDKAAKTGAIHPNNAARRKSRLMKAAARAQAATS